MRVFISSVRQGLETERDSLPGQIRALGHEPVRFEDFTAQTAPSREACLAGVESSDAYLLLLGPHYGTIFSDTGQSATHDEWIRAQTLGLPRYVFKKTGVDFDSEQAAFLRTLGDYASGRFYREFAEPHELFLEVTTVVRQLEQAPNPLEYGTLASPVVVPWWEPSNRSFGQAEPLLEVHVIPLDGRNLPSRILDQLDHGLPARIRASGLVAPAAGMNGGRAGDAVQYSVPDTDRAYRDVHRGGLAFVRVDNAARMLVTYRLPGDGMGAILDESDARERIASALRLAGAADVSEAQHVAVAAGLTSAGMVTLGRATGVPRSSASMRLQSGPVRVDPDESLSRSALDVGASEVAATVARSLVRVFTESAR